MQNEINAIRAAHIPPQGLLVDGKFRSALSGQELDVLSPLDGTRLTTLADAGREDVNLACQSARAAFEAGVWSRTAPAHRKKVLLKLADLIENEALKIAVLGVRDNGTEIAMALKAEPMSAASTFRYYAELIDKTYGEIAPTQSDVLALVHRQPVGVVAVIVPWNFPLMIGAWKIAPALAAGNSVVLKPAETASLTLLRIAELALEAGVPPGIFNVVTGQGAVAGEALGLSMEVDVMAFTGSGGVGRKLLEYSAHSNLKRVYLELGGKSPNIIFADAPDLDKAAKVAAYGIFRNSGQVCIAGSRLLVEASIADQFADKVAKIAASMKVGDPLDLTTEAGALNSETHLDRSLGFAARAQMEGAELLTGGNRILQDTGGWFMAPTVLSKVHPEMEVSRNEVFGPVLAITPFADEAEAICVANDTDFGLASAVWTSNLSRAHRMVESVRAGLVHVNTYGGSDLTVPLGGVKQSGNGHDKSPHALDKYLDLKTAWIQL
ncbi:aldehyde dehydrogenase [Rhizobium leguminosarum]|uniref:aldehyde dehydrogenase n=1 Tax=Rhizobium leguminosarum TaxID=384 RepID=UPI0014414ECD|nr:aldehyde dehydrogenase [Rhizobium leguminosarum]MBY5868680.1 aldehyde dehydrogenase [Rhizobium leguminosarum]NKM08755.1 aldehyde dehydrogenase family protein [Rhizobium leguminosarum bv. viciae]